MQHSNNGSEALISKVMYTFFSPYNYRNLFNLKLENATCVLQNNEKIYGLLVLYAP